VTPQGANLTGYGVGPNGQILAGSPQPLQISTADLKPVATTKVDTSLNLDSRAEPPTNYPFNANDPTTYNKQTPVDVYDSLGNAHVMSMYYVKTGAGTWDVYAGSDGTELTNVNVASAGQKDASATAARDAWLTATKAVPPVQADIAAKLKDYGDKASAAVVAAATAAGASAATISAIKAAATSAGSTPATARTRSTRTSPRPCPCRRAGRPPELRHQRRAVGHPDEPADPAADVNLPIYPPTGAKDTLSIKLNFAGTTQYGADTSEKKTTQDGYTAGHLQRFSAAADGTILGQYSNGQTKPLGQVVLANFTNPGGLEPLGNNSFAETSESGTPLVGTPDTGSLGVLQSSATEASNVDLTAELVNMITAQRVYQANAQTIKTQDSVLQTLVNLR
jgi:flagellar hook protein FlgE